jgi:hypothetical protein
MGKIIWLFTLYGSEEEEIAALMNMGCNYIYQ